MTVSLKYKRSIRQLLHKSVSEWSALSSSIRLLVSGHGMSRPRNTLFLIYRYEKLYCRHTENIQHRWSICCETKYNEACIYQRNHLSFICLRRWNSSSITIWNYRCWRRWSSDHDCWSSIRFCQNRANILEESKPPGVQRLVEITD